ncbi:glycoside hydrolase family 28 protein [Bipolaris maydis ATCC 48331]|uniref:galacturonan 1,4-alpha-galacturonidase n=2 Tax=Cochliobolus heterostrophus TaxID=5016 RepID=M2V6L0_COCH5|nr:glycoside hydrolase family 28 protein [Bipolaris maydis ATCC 48331]EMD95672.1 glycoside hydrolase family 28 protein [Bipolaris maydis C5]KAH7561598.1 glycoside hydrolase family 28 protein [Bipolaris maydis]ENI10532.1 glycoside hydrolase family 28 protein [Bipolaris maydis ATCC 48331]KAJ5065418.1 exo-alpha 1,4-polygalacturonase [Bipolaris maydis]KAJ6200629.1 exo-alpha 1,4-polygalacturonase [Bipolaris maydis]
MRVTDIISCALLQASIALSNPVEELGTKAVAAKHFPPEPFLPFLSGKAPWVPGSRNKKCMLKARGGGKDDSANILSAVKRCNNGGQVVFPKGQHFTIGTALDLTFLNRIDLDIQGTIQFTNDTDYWQANSFKQVYQNATTFFQLGGEDINVYGGGTLDGNGQAWYDLYAKDIYILRPILFGLIGAKNTKISDLKFRYSPQWYTFVANSSEVVFSNIDIFGDSKSTNPAKNTDGWDTYRSNNIVIQNSNINNGDDCVSFKPNSTNILVQNLVCNGSHGISVGSLGQYPGEVDIVENILVRNISMSNASDGARIKVWPGASSALSGDLQGGGGSGAVRNVVYDGMIVNNVDYAIEITQCYGQKNLTLCNEFPSNLTISDITIKNFKGTTSKKYDPLVGYVVCSSPKVCSDISIENINVESPSGTNLFTCANVEGIQSQVNCTAEGNKGGNS